MKILMVCLGNICRSPLAEGIFRHRAQEAGLDWELDSAGTGGWHSGEAPDPRSIAVAAKYGLDISGQRARQLNTQDFERFDHLFVMDSENYQNVLRLASSPAQKAKVELLMNLALPGQNRAVPDPYYGGKEGFEQVFAMIDQACQAFIAQQKN